MYFSYFSSPFNIPTCPIVPTAVKIMSSFVAQVPNSSAFSSVIKTNPSSLNLIPKSSERLFPLITVFHLRQNT